MPFNLKKVTVYMVPDLTVYAHQEISNRTALINCRLNYDMNFSVSRIIDFLLLTALFTVPVSCLKYIFVFCCQSKFPNQTGVEIHKCMEHVVLGEF